MYDEIKNKIYEQFIDNKGKKTAILWSGGPYSSALWFLAYKDLSLEIPVIFVDTGDLAPTLYAHIQRQKQIHRFTLEIKQGKLEDTVKELKKDYEVLYSGRPLEGAITIIPDHPETWNFIRSLNMVFYGGVKKGILY